MSLTLVIGIPSRDSIRFSGDAVQEASFNAAADLLRDQGAEIREIDFTPLYDVADMLYEGAWAAEQYTVIEDLLHKDPEAILPVTRQVICKAEKLSAADAFRGMYRLKELSRIAETALEAAATDGLILVVCGAHMDGLPLNHQLTERGASYLGAAKTTDSYRFYALASDPPTRPGLVKGAPGSGTPRR